MESLSNGLNLGLIGVLNKGLKEGLKVGVIKRVIGNLIKSLIENLIRSLIIVLTESPIESLTSSLNIGSVKIGEGNNTIDKNTFFVYILGMEVAIAPLGAIPCQINLFPTISLLIRNYRPPSKNPIKGVIKYEESRTY
ncbi:MAG: hypothetical protein ABIK99_05290 [candidate division WOR-3 bacterium]